MSVWAWLYGSMTWIDYTFLFIFGVSIAISLMRGFVRESLSLVSWVISFWLANGFADPLAEFLAEYIEVASLRIILSFIALFVVSMMLATAASNLLVDLVDRAGLSGTDRTIGVFFGAARGYVISVILVILMGLTPMPQDDWWKDAYFMPMFQNSAEWVRDLLPDGMARKIIF
ncbi:MAG: CvpA family protein [Gammaproteobacteria bacterium]|nr:CvpA family protein [Gammaproteobacteria bacterium]